MAERADDGDLLWAGARALELAGELTDAPICDEVWVVAMGQETRSYRLAVWTPRNREGRWFCPAFVEHHLPAPVLVPGTSRIHSLMNAMSLIQLFHHWGDWHGTDSQPDRPWVGEPPGADWSLPTPLVVENAWIVDSIQIGAAALEVQIGKPEVHPKDPDTWHAAFQISGMSSADRALGIGPLDSIFNALRVVQICILTESVDHAKRGEPVG